MATEKWIKGKHDDSAHMGRYANVRRLAEAEQRMVDYLEGDEQTDGYYLDKTKEHPKRQPRKHWTDIFFGTRGYIEDEGDRGGR